MSTVYLQRKAVHSIGLSIVLLATILLLPFRSDALTISTRPSSFDEAEQLLTQIEDDLAQAECGGWDWETSLDGLIVDEIWGVPGRQIEGDIISETTTDTGMLEQAQNLDYPTDAWGFTTACRPATPNPWAGADSRHLPPFFDRHACQRPFGDIKPGDPNFPYANEDGIIYSCGGDQLIRYPNPPGADTGGDDGLDSGDGSGGDGDGDGGTVIFGTQTGRTNNPGDTYGGLCDDLNDLWQYWLLEREILEPEIIRGTSTGRWVPKDPPQFEYWKGTCGQLQAPVDGRVFYPDKKILDEELNAKLDEPNTDPSRSDWNNLGAHYCCTDQNVRSEWKNCIVCQGDNCRSQYNTDPNFRVRSSKPVYEGTVVNASGFGARTYISYFRRYLGNYRRDRLPDSTDETFDRTDIPVACYGMYQEYDPKVTRVFGSWKHCVIAVYYDDISFKDAPDTQKYKGEYGQNSSWVDPPFVEDPRNPDFDEDTDMWFPNLGNGVSLVNDQFIDDNFDSDLTYALLAPDEARNKATIPFDVDHPLSSGSLIRSFDDTGIRSLVRWWQRQQTYAHRLFTPPRIRLLLPALWSIGLDKNDPLFSPDIPAVNPPPGYSPEKREQAIEVQIESREDLLGQIADYVKRTSLIEVIEEPVPIVVPLGSATELRVISDGWKRWLEICTHTNDCNTTGADDLITKLDAYADQMDYVRSTRSELSKYIQSIVIHQSQIVTEITKWLEENATVYTDYLYQLDQLQTLSSEWRSIGSTYRHATDYSMPWCRNDRYTLPMYSLLDPWMYGRPLLDDNPISTIFNDATGFPSGPFLMPELTIFPSPDALFDLTGLEQSTKVLKLPVLKPIQVRMDFSKFTPPADTAKGSSLLTGTQPILPDLPSIDLQNPSIAEVITENAPIFSLGTPPKTIGSFSIPNLEGTITFASTEIASMKQMIRGMNAVYRKFWWSFMKPSCLSGSAGYYCVKPEGEEDCYAKNSQTCVHSEMDIIQRLMRLGARPGVQLEEDVLNKAEEPLPNPAEVGYGPHCDPTDFVCQSTQPTRTFPQLSWKLKGPTPPDSDNAEPVCGFTATFSVQDRGTLIDQLRSCIFNETLLQVGVPPEQLFPYASTRSDITPSFSVPEETEGTTSTTLNSNSINLVSPPPFCGDLACDQGETCVNCVDDCGSCPP